MSELSRLAGRAAALLRERAIAGARDSVRSVAAALVWAWERRPPWPRVGAIAFAAAVAVLGAWSVVAQARLASRLPTALDWAAARALLERDARPGDAAALSPPWAERAREVLPASVPLVPQARLAAEELAGVRRVWLVSLPVTPGFRWEAEADLSDRSSRVDPPARIGALEVARFDLASPTLPVAFLPDRLARGGATLGPADCEPAGPGRFRCGASALVERTVREVGGAARPCLSISSSGPLETPLVMSFPPTRIGRTIDGHAGRVGAGSGSAAPVRVSLLIDGEELGSAELAAAGWVPFRIDTSRSAGQVRAVGLVLTSPAPLDLCLEALVLP
jgi:hypothetical protein